MRLLSIENVIESFLRPTISIVEGEVSIPTTRSVEAILIQKQASAQSEFVGGSHSYLGLILDIFRFYAVIYNTFNLYNNPRVLPIFLQDL